MTNDQAVEVVITAPDAEWLRRFVEALVQEHLCSAGHLTEHQTIYFWREEAHSGPEAKAILYTRENLVPTIVERTQNEHPYEVPHVSATPLTAGNPDYLQWILTETTP